MSSSFLGNDLTPMKIAKVFVVGINALGIAVAVNGMVQPGSGAVAFGFHPSTWTARTAASNPFIPIAAGRVIAPMVGGMALLILGYDQALGVSMMCGCITGFLDGLFLYKYAGFIDESKADDGRHTVDIEVAKKAKKQAFGHCALPLMISALGTWIYTMADS